MNLRICILPSQPLKDGRFKIRIALAHNKETRYFVTDYYVSSDKSIKNGVISGKEAGARETNLKVRAYMDKIQNAYDSIEGAEYFSCSELVEMIKEKMKGSKPKTIAEVFDLLRSRKELQGRSESSIKNYSISKKVCIRYFGDRRTLQSLTDTDLLLFKNWLDSAEHYHHTNDPDKRTDKKLGFSQSSQRTIFTLFKAVYNFAVKQRFFIPERDIWDEFEIPSIEKRDCDLTITELRTLRDYKFDDPYLESLRDLIMLSFYLCGMNLADILRQNLSQPIICYRRIKTERSRKPDETTEFTIQPEARAIIDKYWVNGRIEFRGKTSKESINHQIQHKLKEVKDACKIENRLLFYSARKTFAQLCLELGVPDAVLAYCIGDTPRTQTLNFYRSSNRQLADKYIRKVFDFVASNKTIDEAIAEL